MYNYEELSQERIIEVYTEQIFDFRKRYNILKEEEGKYPEDIKTLKNGVRKLERANGEKYTEIEHLSNEKCKCYKNSNHSKRILVWHNNDGTTFIELDKVQPKSIRERLHNVQEAKEFYHNNPSFGKTKRVR